MKLRIVSRQAHERKFHRSTNTKALATPNGSANTTSCSFPSAGERPCITTSTASGGGVPQAGCTKGKQDRGGAPSSGPRALDDFHPAEIRGVAGGRVHQGQECDPLGSGAAGIFHRSAVFNCRICFLVHLTIRPPRIRQSKRIILRALTRARKTPKIPRFKQLWKRY